VKKVRIDTPYPSRAATGKALGVPKTRMRQLAALLDFLLGEGRRKDRKAASIRKPRPRGHSIPAKRARPATAGATSR
jgi:hypothetical protein